MPAVTALYAALLALLVVALGVRVALYRLKARIGVGDGGDARLLRRVRAHGNAVEYVPLGLLLLLLLELSAAPAVGLHAAGGAFALARLLHALGLSRTGGSSLPRMIGASLTFLSLIAMAVWLLVRVAPTLL